MSLEGQLREYYRDQHSGSAEGPDLGSVLDRGRRRRRTRVVTSVAGGTVAVVAVGALAATALTSGGTSTTVPDRDRGADPAAGGPGSVSGLEDFVAGTDVDAVMQQVIADHLPTLGAPDDVYPSDWFTNGPIADADFADATDWQAAYPVGDGEHALLLMGYPDPTEPAGCGDCTQETVPGGTLTTQVSHLQGSAEWLFTTSLVRDDGFTVGLVDYVSAGRLAEAKRDRSISEADARAVVRDPRMHFPAPANPPTGN